MSENQALDSVMSLQLSPPQEIVYVHMIKGDSQVLFVKRQ